MHGPSEPNDGAKEVDSIGFERHRGTLENILKCINQIFFFPFCISYDCNVFLDSLWHLSASGRVSGVSAGIQ